jgi:hypothetical protein
MKISDFDLSTQSQTEVLFESVLNKDEQEQVDTLSLQLFSKKTRGKALEKLRDITKDGPKRPMYYARMYLDDLPRNTRTVVFYLSSYIDCLMKHVSSEKGTNILRALFTSLKNNIEYSKKVLGPELIENLNRYEKFIYTPAKHDFDLRPERPHLFSSREAVSICFVTMKLAKQLINLSDEAKDYSLNKFY